MHRFQIGGGEASLLSAGDFPDGLEDLAGRPWWFQKGGLCLVDEGTASRSAGILRA